MNSPLIGWGLLVFGIVSFFAAFGWGIVTTPRNERKHKALVLFLCFLATISAILGVRVLFRE
jgi:hypothetical protein